MNIESTIVHKISRVDEKMLMATVSTFFFTIGAGIYTLFTMELMHIPPAGEVDAAFVAGMKNTILMALIFGPFSIAYFEAIDFCKVNHTDFQNFQGKLSNKEDQ